MSQQSPTPRSSDPEAPPASPDTGQADATGTPAAGLDLKPGASPVADYTLICLLGRGGFGEVWKADGPGGIKIAMKFVRLQEKTGEIEQRALDIIKNIRDPHLLDVYGSWQRSGVLILAMQLADKSLLQRLDERRRQDHDGLPFEEALDHLRDAARGLDHLHRLGIQHRDVKPHNLLLVGGGVKVADFGLAKVLEQTRKTHSGGMSIAYAPPEFFQGQVTSQSDQYSLAVTYCQLRGGSLPFGGNEYQLLYGHLHAEPDLSMLSEAERPAVARALAKKPEDRWPSCRAFVEALTAAVVGHVSNVPEEKAGWKPTPHQAEFPPTLTDRRFRRTRRKPLLLVGSLLAACIAVLLGLVYWQGPTWKTGSPDTQQALRQPPKEEQPPQSLKRDQPEPEPLKKSEPEPKKQPEPEPPKTVDPPPRPSLELDCEETMTFEAGSKAVLRVAVQRKNCKGPARVEIVGLPAGVTAPPVTLPEGVNVARLELTANPDVELKNDPLNVRARLDDVEETTTVRLTVTARPSLTLLAIAPVRIEAGQRQSVTVRLQRKNCPGPVKLVFTDLPEGVAMPSVPLGAAEDTAQADLRAAAPALAVQAATVHVVALGDRAKADGQFELTVVRPKPRDEKEITNTLGMKLVLIPAGEFRMGSLGGDDQAEKDEKPQHDVKITKSFYLGKHEVTRGQFRQFMEANPDFKTDAEKMGEGGYGYNAEKEFVGYNPKYTWRDSGFQQTDDHPVVNVSWNDAKAFCKWLSTKEGKEYVLPSEAQWEYACRANTTTRFWSGDDEMSLRRIANIADKSLKEKWKPSSIANETFRKAISDWFDRVDWDDGFPFTAPVIRSDSPPNAFGLCDMHGNVWEWCEDWYDENYYKDSPREDPPGPGAGSFRVFRGGSFDNDPRFVRAANRDRDFPAYRICFLGFRVLRAR